MKSEALRLPQFLSTIYRRQYSQYQYVIQSAPPNIWREGGEMKHGRNNGTLALLWRPCTSPRQPFVVFAVSCPCPHLPPPLVVESRWGLSVPIPFPHSHICLSDSHLLTHTHMQNFFLGGFPGGPRADRKHRKGCVVAGLLSLFKIICSVSVSDQNSLSLNLSKSLTTP